jgi:hypothetical protein
MVSCTSILKLLTLVFLVNLSEFAFLQQEDGDDDNVTSATDSTDLAGLDLTSRNSFLFTNYNALRDEEGQGFFLREAYSLYETLDSSLASVVVIDWWCDLEFIGSEGHDEDDTHPNSKTSDFSATGKYTKITAEEAAKYLGMDVSDLIPGTCTKQYKEVWNATHLPDPINKTTMTAIEVAQLKAENEELKADNKRHKEVGSTMFIFLIYLYNKHNK